MIKSANNKCFAELLSPQAEENKTFKIPDYQRPYAWTKYNCEDLYNDIMDADPGYFVGSMIWVNESEPKYNMIIDGQQRFTTLSLFLIAIYDKLSVPGVLEGDVNISRRVNLKNLLVNDNNSPKLILQIEQNNREDYKYLIDAFVVKEYSPIKPLNYGNRRIGKNYKLICDFLEGKNTEDLLELLNKIKKLTFVAIEVDEYQSAYQLFEAMNNRGLALTPVDLIKNIFISKTGDGNGWAKFIDYLGDEPRDQDQFFRYNYNAFRAEYNNVSDFSSQQVKYEIGSRAIKSNIIKIYQQIIEGNPHGFLEEIVRKAKIYNLMLGFSGENDEKIFFDKFADFRNAKSTGAFILLMYLYYYRGKFGFEDEGLVNLFDKILIFFIRRNLTNYPGTGAIPGILMDIIEKINKLPENERNYLKVESLVVDKLNAESSSDEVVKEMLSGSMYLDNRDMTRFLLCRYEESFPTTKEKKIDLWSYKNGKYIWTIEHVFPEGENIPDCWVDMIADGDKDKAKKYLEEYAHKLGNLTMTGYNSELGNYSFDTKKNLISNGVKVGYNNGLHLNEYIFSQDKWDVQNIVDRTKDLVESIIASLKI